VRPVVLAAGASGSEVADDVEEDVAEEVDDDVEADVESDVRSEVEADAEADVGDGVAEESVGREEASDVLDTVEVLPSDDAVKLSVVVVDAVLSALETGDDVSHAVSGPNSWTR
jgi:predicted  nucleic acid-binding Zn-ribbon protein